MDKKELKRFINGFLSHYGIIVLLITGLGISLILTTLFYEKIPYLDSLIRIVLVFTPFLIISLNNLSRKEKLKHELYYLVVDLKNVISLIKAYYDNGEPIDKDDKSIISNGEMSRFNDFVEKFMFLTNQMDEKYDKSLQYKLRCDIKILSEDYHVIIIDKYRIDKNGIYDLENEEYITSNEEKIANLTNWLNSKYIYM